MQKVLGTVKRRGRDAVCRDAVDNPEPVRRRCINSLETNCIHKYANCRISPDNFSSSLNLSWQGGATVLGKPLTMKEQLAAEEAKDKLERMVKVRGR